MTGACAFVLTFGVVCVVCVGVVCVGVAGRSAPDDGQTAGGGFGHSWTATDS